MVHLDARTAIRTAGAVTLLVLVVGVATDAHANRHSAGARGEVHLRRAATRFDAQLTRSERRGTQRDSARRWNRAATGIDSALRGAGASGAVGVMFQRRAAYARLRSASALLARASSMRPRELARKIERARALITHAGPYVSGHQDAAAFRQAQEAVQNAQRRLGTLPPLRPR